MPLTHSEIVTIFDPLMLATIAAQPLEYRVQRSITFLRMGIHRTVVKNLCAVNEQQMQKIEITTARITQELGPFA